MTLSADLLSILACPDDKGALYYIESESVLYNPRLTRAYAVRDGIPVMLIDEASSVDAAENDRLMALVESQGISPTFTE